MNKIKAKFNSLNALMIFLSLVTIFLTYIKTHFDTYISGDTGQYYSIIYSLHQGLGSFNTFLPTIVDFTFIKELPVLSIDQLCGMDFNVLSYTQDKFYHFKFHFYAILYPISVLLYFFNVSTVVQGINILAFTATLFIIFAILKKRLAPTWLSLLIICVVSLHPAWSLSITGQAYVDRLYLPFAIVIFYLIEKEKKSDILLYVIAAISSLIVEKIFIINTIFFISYAILYPSNKFIFMKRFIFSLTSAVIFGLLIGQYINSPSYSSTIPTSFAAIKNLFGMDYYVNGLIAFLAINMLFLLPALFSRKRLFIIGLIMLMPNIFGNIGGAEKIGFTTHYHSLYFPFIIYIFAISISDIYTQKGKSYKITIYLLLITSSFLFISFGLKNTLEYKFENYKNNYLFYFYNLYTTKPRDLHSIQQIVDSTIPLDSKVSTVESGMPFLFKHQDTHMFPLNISSSDFLVVSHLIKNGRNYYYGYQGYYGENHTSQVSDCLNKKILHDSRFDTKYPIILSPGLAILKRTH